MRQQIAMYFTGRCRLQDCVTIYIKICNRHFLLHSLFSNSVSFSIYVFKIFTYIIFALALSDRQNPKPWVTDAVCVKIKVLSKDRGSDEIHNKIRGCFV